MFSSTFWEFGIIASNTVNSICTRAYDMYDTFTVNVHKHWETFSSRESLPLKFRRLSKIAEVVKMTLEFAKRNNTSIKFLHIAIVHWMISIRFIHTFFFLFSWNRFSSLIDYRVFVQSHEIWISLEWNKNKKKVKQIYFVIFHSTSSCCWCTST